MKSLPCLNERYARSPTIFEKFSKNHREDIRTHFIIISDSWSNDPMSADRVWPNTIWHTFAAESFIC